MEQRLENIRWTLLTFRRNYRKQRPYWRNFEAIVQRYHRLCEQLHIGAQYYRLKQSSDGNELSFRKDVYQVAKAEALFGKNIIVTDNTDWKTDDIVQASLNRWRVEKAFRDTKTKQHISTHPMFLWTESKIRCHLLACIIALTMRCLLELQVETVLGRVSVEKIIEEMRALRSLVIRHPGRRKPQQQIEDLTPM